MTKKIILTLLIISSSLFAATNKQIIAYFQAQIPIPNVKITITSRLKMDNFNDMYYVSAKMSNGERIQKISVFTQGDLIFPDVISVKSKASLRENIAKKKLISSLAKIYKKEYKKNIIQIGNDPKKETLVEFTDPECPFCNKRINNIRKKLKTYNIKFILTPVHNGSALEKSALIYRQFSKTNKLEDKIKILQKYYNGEVDKKVTDDEIQRIKKLRRKYFHAGLKGVPFYINETKLLTNLTY